MSEVGKERLIKIEMKQVVNRFSQQLNLLNVGSMLLVAFAFKIMKKGMYWMKLLLGTVRILSTQMLIMNSENFWMDRGPALFIYFIFWSKFSRNSFIISSTFISFSS